MGSGGAEGEGGAGITKHYLTNGKTPQGAMTSESAFKVVLAYKGSPKTQGERGHAHLLVLVELEVAECEVEVARDEQLLPLRLLLISHLVVRLRAERKDRGRWKSG